MIAQIDSDSSEFAASSGSYVYNETDIISLFLYPGSHSLNEELHMAYVGNFSMIKVAQEDETVIIECTDSHARLRIIETAIASIKGLHFNGCGYNILIWVIQFKLEDTIFAGAEDRGRALELRMVTAATIVNCTFTHCNEFITYGYGAAIFAT